jgi:hypothetical protein
MKDLEADQHARVPANAIWRLKYFEDKGTHGNGVFSTRNNQEEAGAIRLRLEGWNNCA